MEARHFIEDVTTAGRKKEIDVKVNRIVNLLQNEGLSALYLTRQPNFSWVTAGASNTVTICTEVGVASILVTKSGDRYIITDKVEEARLRNEQRLEELGFQIISQEWYDNKYANIISKLAGNLDKIGADVYFENTKMIQEKINPLRFSLTHNEICRYQYLGDEMSQALECYLQTVRPGMSEFEIAGGISKVLWPKGIDPVLFLVAADERILHYRHAIPTSNKVKHSLMVSCNGRYKGLITTTTRMVYFGQPPRSLLDQYQTTAEIENRMIATTQPGVDELIPHLVGKEAYEEFGYAEMYYKHHQGGAQGYYNRNYLISETKHEITQENQCYCYNPAIDGTKTEDAFIATSQGPLMITKPFSFPKLTSSYNGITIERPGILILD